MNAAERRAAKVASLSDLKVGDKVFCVYGRECEIIKVNDKSALIPGSFGKPIKLEKHLIISISSRA